MAAALVITFHSEDVIDPCLDALERWAPELEVVVIDNASTDATAARAKQHKNAKLIQNQTNRGFSGAVNQGFLATTADAVLILNPDVCLETPLDPLLAACRQSGIAAGRLLDPNGSTQHGFTVRRFPNATVLGLELLGINRLWPSNPWNRRYRYLDFDAMQPAEVDQPAGAFLMVRRDVWETLGGFDEAFHPVWFEDVDFCKRAAEAGFRARLTPEVAATHVGGSSIRKLPPSSRELYWYASLLRYAEKHFPPLGYRCLCAVSMLSVPIRAVQGMIRQRSPKPVANSIKILILAGRRLVSRSRRTPAVGSR